LTTLIRQQQDLSYDTLQDDRDDLPMQIHFELDDFPLSAEAFRVYAHLVRRAGKSRKAWPSYQNIGETCFRASYPNAAKSTLKIKAIDAVRELVAHRLIVIEHQTAAAGDATSNIYHITPRSQWTVERAVEFDSINIRTGGRTGIGGRPKKVEVVTGNNQVVTPNNQGVVTGNNHGGYSDKPQVVTGNNHGGYSGELPPYAQEVCPAKLSPLFFQPEVNPIEVNQIEVNPSEVRAAATAVNAGVEKIESEENQPDPCATLPEEAESFSGETTFTGEGRELRELIRQREQRRKELNSDCRSVQSSPSAPSAPSALFGEDKCDVAAAGVVENAIDPETLFQLQVMVYDWRQRPWMENAVQFKPSVIQAVWRSNPDWYSLQGTSTPNLKKISDRLKKLDNQLKQLNADALTAYTELQNYWTIAQALANPQVEQAFTSAAATAKQQQTYAEYEAALKRHQTGGFFG